MSYICPISILFTEHVDADLQHLALELNCEAFTDLQTYVTGTVIRLRVNDRREYQGILANTSVIQYGIGKRVPYITVH